MNQIDPASTALMVMDVQPGILARVEDADAFVDRIAGTLALARGVGVHVGYVRVAFTDDDLAAVPAHSSFAAVATDPERRANLSADSPASDIDPRLAPTDGDIVVRKTRVGPFSTTDLQEQLDSRGITTLVLTGVATSGVVLSTVRQAADLDYRVVVVSDEVADSDPAVHDLLVTKLFPRQAEVVTSAELAAALA